MLIAAVLVLAAAVGAPLGVEANAGMSPNPAKAPWYFVGFQELLIHLHPTVAVLLLPVLALAIFVALPFLAAPHGPTGRWFLSEIGTRACTIAAGTAVVVTPLLVLVSDRLGDGATGWFAGGVLPLLVMVVMVMLLDLLLARVVGVPRDERRQASVTLFAVGFIVLTVIAQFFRGAGMALGWPWGA